MSLITRQCSRKIKSTIIFSLFCVLGTFTGKTKIRKVPSEDMNIKSDIKEGLLGGSSHYSSILLFHHFNDLKK